METKREWTTIKEYEEILFDFYNGIARITINRERYRIAHLRRRCRSESVADRKSVV